MTGFITKHSTFFIGLLITLTVVFAEAATTFDPQSLTDVRMWFIGVVVASVRQAGVYVLRTVAARGGTT